MQQELAERDAMIQDLQNRMEQMQGRLNMQAHVAPAPPCSALTVQAHPPEEFTGDCTKFEGWISQLNLFFSLNVEAVPTDRQRVLFACSYIKGPAYTYVQALVNSATTDQSDPMINNYGAFYTYLKTVFSLVDEEGEAQ